MADCLKKYLRTLPESLMPDDLYEEYMAVGKKFWDFCESGTYLDFFPKSLDVTHNPSASHIESIPLALDKDLEEDLCFVINKLPTAHEESLRQICQLLHRIQSFSTDNK